MNKKILLYSLIYLSTYLFILIFSLVFQWGYICNFEISICYLNSETLKTILQTSAPIITPLVLIWGYFSWKEQELYKTSTELLATCLSQTNIIFKAWKKSRDYSNVYSRFSAYHFRKMHPINHEILDSTEISNNELNRITDVYLLINDLYFTLNHLFIVNKHLNLDNIFEKVKAVSLELETNMNELSEFQHELICIKNNYTNKVSPEKVKEICYKLDSSLSVNTLRIDDHNIKIDKFIEDITAQITKLSRKLN
ncbi:hypothetical protein F7P73_18010 [Acinetobacter bohemicus]|jgi:hypothetical protein|nr:hypothetical protein [Acinetobacter bohemicus]KAB0649743.1 hypothetical protein F7P73_18010 [Acinetobacter bohemicus]